VAVLDAVTTKDPPMVTTPGTSAVAAKLTVIGRDPEMVWVTATVAARLTVVGLEPPMVWVTTTVAVRLAVTTREPPMV
jgi:hypothetical protein